jgi:hypothetical protein
MASRQVTPNTCSMSTYILYSPMVEDWYHAYGMLLQLLS